MKTETILYGTRNGAESWEEVILSTDPKRFVEIKALAAADGFGRFRVALIDLTVPPNFAGAINGCNRKGIE